MWGEGRGRSWRGIRVSVSAEDASGCLVLRVRGDLDYLTAPDVLAWAGRVIRDSGGSPRVVLDLGEVAFFDSSGLGAVVELWKDALAAGGELGVARPARTCLLMLRRTGLAGRIEMTDSVAGTAELLRAGARRETRSRSPGGVRRVSPDRWCRGRCGAGARTHP